MRFDHEFSVAAPDATVWAFLMDVPSVAGCIPGATEVAMLDDATYSAVVTARIGPITARFACRVAILGMDDATRTGSVEVSGKDTKLGGGVKATMRIALDGHPPTTVRITSDVDILGKIGHYGHGMIAKRAEAMLVDFAACVQVQIADGAR